MDFWNILLDMLCIGMPYGILALGVFISYRVLDFADLTTEGTYVLGASIGCLLILNGMNPWVATLFAMFGGFLAGTVTALLHTKLKIPGLLAGIITMTGLFSVNMLVMGAVNGFSWNTGAAAIYLSPGTDKTIFSFVEDFVDLRKYAVIIVVSLITLILSTIMYLFFGTEFGMSMRATGMNSKMARAQGINTTLCTIIGLGISNALIALSSVIEAQRAFGTSTQNGTGMIVVGLAAIIIGESVIGKKTFKRWMNSVILGGMLYYLIIAIALELGLPNHLLKLLYAILIVIILAAPLICGKIKVIYNSPKLVQKREEKKKQNEAKLQEKLNSDPIFKTKYDEKQARIKEKEENKLKKQEELEHKLESKRKKSKAYLIKFSSSNQEKEKKKEEKLQAKLASNPSFKEKYELKLAKEKEEKELHNKYIEENGMLHVENLTKKFNPTGNPEDLKIALNGIDLSIKEGEFVTIIGGNGSGKSTFFNTVSGTYKPEDGKIFVNGKNVTKQAEYRRAFSIGRVAQDPYQGTAHNMSILENMSLAMRRNKTKTLRWGFNKAHTELFTERVETLGLGLEKRMSTKIGNLSGGQRQAVTLLMATLQRPDILFLDEHTAALDPKTAKTVLELTDKIVKEQNLTAVMVTHNMKDAIKYGNRLLMFNNGQVIYDVKGEEKMNLTVEQLLKKFESKVEFSDKDILATD